MDAARVARELAHAAETLDVQHDVPHFTADLLVTCQDVLDVDAVGVMLAAQNGRLQLFAASSHTSAELELHQSQVDEGPCVDAATTVEPTWAAGADELSQVWPTFGPAMVDAGFHAVHSSPLRWGGTALGAMALFRRSPEPFDEAEHGAAQAFADLLSRLVMRGDRDADLVDVRIEDALRSRVVIELAKGVIVQEGGMDTGEAYDLLRTLAAVRGQSLSDVAHDLVGRAARGPVDLSA